MTSKTSVENIQSELQNRKKKKNGKENREHRNLRRKRNLGFAWWRTTMKFSDLKL